MLNLYIDFDGVIVNTIDITYKMASLQGIKKDYANYLQFFQNLNWEEVLEKASPINDSFNEIKKIINSNKFNVAILTHVTSIHEAEAKIKLINKYLDNITIITVPKSVSKTKVINTNKAILIDDFSHNLDDWEENGGKGVRFDLDLDGKGYPVIDRLSQIISMF